MDEADRIRSALAHLDASMSRNEWVKVAMAIKSELGEKGFQIFDEWSKTASNYITVDARDAWKSIKPNGPVKIGTLFKMAKGQGWKDTHKPNPTTSDDLSKQRNAERAAAEEAELKAKRVKAAKQALEVWMQASTARLDHPYLMRKGVQPTDTLRELDAKRVREMVSYQPKSDGKPLSGRILIAPVKVSGKISTLEMIDENGLKSALSGGQKSSGYWATGPVKDGAQPDQIVLIAEGVATALSAAQATGHIAVAALSLGNLAKTASAIKKELPAARIVVLADINKATGKPCVDAEKAAMSVNGLCIAPDFGGERAENETDFNDLHVSRGIDAVAEQINKLLQNAAAGSVPGEGKFSRAKSNLSGKSNPSTILYHPYLGGRFEVDDDGVRFAEKKEGGGWNKGVPICSRLNVVALTRDGKGGEWGRLLEWRDKDGALHRWAMPLELLQGDGTDVRRELVRQGLHLETSKTARERLTAYINSWPVERLARCVDKLGWNGATYVTPLGAVGEGAEPVVFQNSSAIDPAISTSGSLQEWRDTVAFWAQGNSRLIFAISAALAGPLADITKEDSGGFHLIGASSSGKSSTLKVAGSVWGAPNSYVRSWRSTTNGLESIAALHNDGTLILDELSQMDPKEAGQASYLLSNGLGKTRATRTGVARQAAKWRLIFLSAGEESIASLMSRVGMKANAGQEIRLADVEADAGAGLGAFECLHHFESPAALSVSIKDAANQFHGAAGVEWLKYLVANRTALESKMSESIKQFVSTSMPPESSGQIERVARRFALVAIAGELATIAGITGWKTGDATTASRKCFSSWIELFGGAGNKEDREIVETTLRFLSLHGSARFETTRDRGEGHDPRTINRVGFYEKGDDGIRHFFVFPSMLSSEVCLGYQSKAVVKALLNAGILIPSKNGEPQQKRRLPDVGSRRVYVLQYNDEA